MSELLKKVGFDRTLELSWLETTIQLASQEHKAQEINAHLEEMLLDQIKGKEARRKTRTVLLAVWVKTRKDLQEFRSDAFELWKKIPQKQHLPIHWGMSMAVHPFFGDVAAITGRLIHLQGHAQEAEIQRRIRENYGERETVSRAVQRLLTSFVNWGVLTSSGKPKIYKKQKPITIENEKLKTWLVEALLYSHSLSSKNIQSIPNNPVFFPFDFNDLNANELSKSSRLEIIHHSLDEKLVTLRPVFGIKKGK